MSISPNSQNLSLDKKRHSFAHLMAAAVQQMFPEAQFGVGPVIENGCYYDFILPRTLIPEDLPLIENKIKEMLKQPLVFKVQEMELQEAIVLFEKMNQPLKVELLNDLATRGTTAMSEEEKADFEGQNNQPENADIEHLYQDSIKQGFNRINVGAVIRNNEGKVLLCKRSPEKKVSPNLWHIPGGKVEGGETLAEALKHEIEEELAVNLVRVVKYTGVNGDYTHGEVKARTLYFEVEVDDITKIVLNEENSDYTFASTKDLQNLELVGLENEDTLALYRRIFGENESSTIIRKATADDAESINLIREVGYKTAFVNPNYGINSEDMNQKEFNNPEQIQRRIQSIENPDYYYLVAEIDKKVIGFIFNQIKGRNSIESFYVLPEYQNLGIGSSLLQESLDKFEDGEIFVETLEYTKQSLAFYHKYGFVETGKKSDNFVLPNGKVLPVVELKTTKKEIEHKLKTNTENQNYVYRIIQKQDLITFLSQEFYEPKDLETDGFIHLSKKSQIVDVANVRFDQADDLVALKLDISKIKNEIKYEDDGNGNIYPHLYGKLETNSLVEKVELLYDQGKNSFVLSEEEKAGLGDNLKILNPSLPTGYELKKLTEDLVPSYVDFKTQSWIETYPNPEAGITKEDIATHMARKSRDEFIKYHVDFTNSSNITTFVLLKDDKVVGSLGYNSSGEFNVFHEIYLLNSQQNKGLARTLFNFAVQNIDPNKDMEVQVAKYNKKAIGFYEKMGFEYDSETEEYELANSGKKFMLIKMVMSKEKIQGLLQKLTTGAPQSTLPKITIYRLENEKTGEDLFVDLCKGPHVESVREMGAKQFPSLRGGKTEGFDGVDPNPPEWKQKSLFPFWNLPKNKDLENKAKELRKAGVLSETLFWQAFNQKEILGFDLDRQYIIGNYIVDFFIPELGLVFEIDGESHDFKGEYDQARESYLKNLDLEIVHYKDEEIKKSMDFVSDSLQGTIKNRVKALEEKKKSTPPATAGTPQSTLPKITIYRLENEKTGEDLFVDLCKGPHVDSVRELAGLSKKSEAEIEEAKIEDIRDIMNLKYRAMKSSFGEYGISEDDLKEECLSENKYQKYLEYFKSTTYVVAKLNNKIVGVAALPNDGVIRTVWVDPEFQNKKIGTKLLRYTLNKAFEKFNEVSLSTGYHDDGRAMAFYKKFGFKETCKVEKFKLTPNQQQELESIELKLTKDDYKNHKDSPIGFSLDKFSGSYWRGDQERNIQMQRIYALVFDTKEELKEFQTKREEAKKRDHRVLNEVQKYYTISDLVGSGLPLFQPKLATARRLLESYLWQINKKRGSVQVITPHIAKKDLYVTSGHWDKFGDELLKVQGQYDDFCMKPMNCPHHMQIFKDQQWSYKDLPVRYFEPATVYRDEKPGQLSGLTRVRSITQDDGHLFCRLDQITDEAVGVSQIITEFYETINMREGYWVSLSVRDPNTPEKYLGTDENWKLAEEALETAAKKEGLNYKRVEGEAAFYGPKLDFMFKDSLGREWQLATVQCDFNLPQRFDLEYTDEKGEKQKPVVIHRAILGSYERFLGVYIEHVAGRFPFWLAPTQVKILTINNEPETLDYVAKIKEILNETVLMKPLKYNEIRFEVDERNEGLGKKIREAEMQKNPVILIVGPKDIAAGEISVRTQEGESKVKLGDISKYLSELQ